MKDNRCDLQKHFDDGLADARISGDDAVVAFLLEVLTEEISEHEQVVHVVAQNAPQAHPMMGVCSGFYAELLMTTVMELRRLSGCETIVPSTDEGSDA